MILTKHDIDMVMIRGACEMPKGYRKPTAADRCNTVIPGCYAFYANVIEGRVVFPFIHFFLTFLIFTTCPRSLVLYAWDPCFIQKRGARGFKYYGVAKLVPPPESPLRRGVILLHTMARRRSHVDHRVSS